MYVTLCLLLDLLVLLAETLVLLGIDQGCGERSSGGRAFHPRAA